MHELFLNTIFLEAFFSFSVIKLNLGLPSAPAKANTLLSPKLRINHYALHIKKGAAVGLSVLMWLCRSYFAKCCLSALRASHRITKRRKSHHRRHIPLPSLSLSSLGGGGRRPEGDSDER